MDINRGLKICLQANVEEQVSYFRSKLRVRPISKTINLPHLINLYFFVFEYTKDSSELELIFFFEIEIKI